MSNMYESEDDKDSLNSSFWSDGERREEEETVEIGQVIGEKDSKSLVNPEESYKEAPESQQEEIKQVMRGEESKPGGKKETVKEEVKTGKPVGDTEDSYQEESEEDESEPDGDSEDSDHEDSDEEVSKPVGDTEESFQEDSREEESKSDESDQEESEAHQSKPPGDTEDSHQEDSEVDESDSDRGSEESYQEDSEEGESEPVESEEDPDQEESEEGQSKPDGDSENSYQEDSDRKESEIFKEDSKPPGDTEDAYQEDSEVDESESDRGSEESYQEDSEEGESEPVESEEDLDQEETEEEQAKPDGDSENSYREDSKEQGSKPNGGSGDSYQEDSGEVSKTNGESKNSFQEDSKKEESKPESGSEDPYQENSEEEQSKPVGKSENSYPEEDNVEMGQVIGEERSKPDHDSDDSFYGDGAGDTKESKQEECESVGDSEDSNQEISEGEEDEDEQAIRQEPVGYVEDSHQEASEEEKPELFYQVDVGRENLEAGCYEDEAEESSDSPAPSLMTSGYGTYRPEEQDGGDYRDDHTITEFDQDSRGDLSEMRDYEEDDRSLCSFAVFDVEPTEPDDYRTRPLSLVMDAKPEVDVSVSNVIDSAEDKLDVNNSEGLSASEEGKHYERLEEEEQELKEDKDESDESSSNKDIKFIDSQVDFSQMTFEQMCEWEGNLRQKNASCLEERLAGLHLSPSARCDLDTENEDVSSHSDDRSSETDGVSLSAFDSYMRGLTRTQSDGDLRPKPKSFIRPVMSQQTVKKTDPVTKYFQYKQLWEMFKLPGEQDRRALRLEIKERLAYQPPPPKPRRVFVPNTYMVPTEKKRSALRWEIRTDLANGVLPHRFSYRY